MNKLTLKDEYKIFDKLNEMQRKNPKIGPVGWVRAFMKDKNDEDRKLFFEGPNMVVASGRYFVAQKIFDVADGTTDYRPYKISHFGVGAGGATISGTAVTLLGPHVCDTSMYQPICLGGTHDEPGMFSNPSLTAAEQKLYNYRNALKKIESLTLVDEDYNESGSSCTKKTKVKCECIVEPGEPGALSVNGYVPINEAGLYFVGGNDAQMFAHVTFPPKYKEVESTLSIDWFILC